MAQDPGEDKREQVVVTVGCPKMLANVIFNKCLFSPYRSQMFYCQG